MSKYDKLWEYVFKDGRDQFTLSFEEIGRIAGVPIDHAFLTYKKELAAYGYRVEKDIHEGKNGGFPPCGTVR